MLLEDINNAQKLEERTSNCENFGGLLAHLTRVGKRAEEPPRVQQCTKL
jgi:hypothetical protein